MELLDVAVFDLLHHGVAAEKIGLQTRGDLTRHDEKLVVDHFRKRDGAARRNEMLTPLKHEAAVPE